jgi:hypothetical protein
MPVAPAMGQTAPGTAVTNDPFEVLGRFYSGSAPSGSALGDGWAQGASLIGVLDETGVPTVDPDTGLRFRSLHLLDQNWGNEGHGFDSNVFAGRNKNNDHIGVNDRPWEWEGGGTGGPQKNDLTNAYLHTRKDPVTGDRWVFVGAETRSTNGDSHVDFEFNQAGITQEGNSEGRLIGHGPLGGRTIGDFLISIDFEQGGEAPVATVRFWNGTGYELVPTPPQSYSATNLVDIPHGADGTWKHYAGDGATVEVITRLQFVEAGINLTALGVGFDACAPEATFITKTRSSASFRADLKDFVILHFPLEPPPDAEMTAPGEVCPGDTFEVTAAENVGFPDPRFTWEISGCGTIFGDPTGSVVMVEATGDCPCEIDLSVSVRAGECNHESMVQKQIVVRDETIPQLENVPADQTVECDAVPAPAAVTATDGCSEATVDMNETTEPGSCVGQYLIRRTWTATDACGNQSSQLQVITVQDTTAPVLEGVPADTVAECDSVPAAATVTATDNCSTATVEFSESVEPGTCEGQSILTRTWTATDECGNQSSQSQVITIQDTTAPVLDGVPSDVTVECDAVPDAPVVSATDNCSQAAVELTETTEAGACAGSYNIVRTWKVTDDCGNQSSQTQTITVQDTTAPVLEGAPDDQNTECDAVPEPTVVTATDNCSDPVVEMSESTEQGACEGQYVLTRTWTATDDCGNQSSQSQVIVVDDTTALILNGVPADETVECDAIPDLAEVTADDNCSEASIAVEETIEPGACEGSLIVTRTWTATDACANQSVHTQVITVQDTSPPVLAGVPADTTVECHAIPDPPAVTATDNCSEATVTLTESSEPGGCGDSRTITRTWTATDDCGNQSSQSQVITVQDTTIPTLEGVPADTTVSCNSIPEPAQVTVTDNCSGAVVELSESSEPGTCIGESILVRTWTATDPCGNQTTQSQIITILDTDAPVLEGVPPDVTVECNAIPDPAEVTATDACSDAVVALSETTEGGACAGSFTIRRTWTATDACGNQSSLSQFITVQDTAPPVLAGVPEDEIATCDSVPAPAAVTATDDCFDPIVELTETSEPGECDGQYTLTRTWTATDGCGNQTSQSQIIVVEDITAPVLAGIPEDQTVECDTIPDPADVTASDTCSAAAVVVEETSEPGACAGLQTITRTWTATDACGNQATHTQIITVQDTTAPILVDVPADTTVECDAISDAPLVNATDTCSVASVAFTESSEPGACAGTQVITRTWTATDECGNESSRSQVITVVDTTAPVLEAIPTDMTVECDSAPDPALVTATDNCSVAIIDLSESVEPGACEGQSVLTRTWTATDECGNQSSQSQVITIQDITAPVLELVPADVTADCDNVPDPPVVTATDNCSYPVVELTETTETGACGGLSNIQRTWTATDDCGNTSSQTQIITVQDLTTPDLAGVPADEMAECDAVPVPAAVTASDNCSDPVVELSEVTEPGACQGEYLLMRTWTATDDCDNQTAQTQVITVKDTTAPELNGVPADVTVACEAVLDAPSVTATDNCSEAAVVMDEFIDPGACAGSYTVTRTWTATDACGNQSAQSQVITVEDTIAPVLEGVPVAETPECDAVPDAPVVTATDACTEAVVELFESSEPGTCEGSNIITRTWVATDECGNESSASQVITLQDTTAPVMSDEPADTTVECGPVPDPAAITASDNCDPHVPVQFAEDTVAGDCPASYQLVRTWTAEDQCGNATYVDQTVTVQDTTAPVISVDAPSGDVFLCDGPATALVEATDECSALAEIDCQVTADFPERVILEDLGDGLFRITLLGAVVADFSCHATDECGNASDATVFTLRAQCGKEACSPGYWRNNFEDWCPTGFNPLPDYCYPGPATLFLDAFEITEVSSPEIPADFDPAMTLSQAVDTTGGGFNQLLFQGGAALISAAHPDLDFPASVCEIIQLMQDVFVGLMSVEDGRAQMKLWNDAERECGCSFNGALPTIYDCPGDPGSGPCNGDGDGDGDVDLDDLLMFTDCLSGPGISPAGGPTFSVADCLNAFDFDDDVDVDVQDFGDFQMLFNVPIP